MISKPSNQPWSTNILANASLNREAGTLVVENRLAEALRIRVNISAIGCVFIIVIDYQEAFLMPGKKPWLANSRKQIRQILKSRM